MSKRLSSVAAVLGAGFFLWLFGGCPAPRGHLQPLPRRAVTPGDVIGAWRYASLPTEDGSRGWIITVEFSEDGTFRQTLVPPRARNLIVHTGAWRIEGQALKLEMLIVWDETAANHWAPRAQTWPMIESAKRSGAPAVFGGLAADHSLDEELDRISATECRLLTSVAPAAKR